MTAKAHKKASPIPPPALKKPADGGTPFELGDLLYPPIEEAICMANIFI